MEKWFGFTAEENARGPALHQFPIVIRRGSLRLTVVGAAVILLAAVWVWSRLSTGQRLPDGTFVLLSLGLLLAGACGIRTLTQLDRERVRRAVSFFGLKRSWSKPLTEYAGLAVRVKTVGRPGFEQVWLIHSHDDDRNLMLWPAPPSGEDLAHDCARRISSVLSLPVITDHAIGGLKTFVEYGRGDRAIQISPEGIAQSGPEKWSYKWEELESWSARKFGKSTSLKVHARNGQSHILDWTVIKRGLNVGRLINGLYRGLGPPAKL